MSAGNHPSLDLTLPGLVSQLHEVLSCLPGHPGERELEELCATLYSASLLKEEGRVVRARVIIAPPEAFPLEGGPPDGAHVIRFTVKHPLTANEIKRLSPSASFFHSAVAVWPDRDRGFRIWGILNTGPRWLNLVAGGRKPMGNEIPYPIVHVRDPGWLLFYRGYNLLAEWRGRDFHGPRMDVFQSNLLLDRFADLRRRMVMDLQNGCLPPLASLDNYADLAHRIALQFIKRIINLVRTSGHGGSLVYMPDGQEGLDAMARWVDCKYAIEPDDAGLRFAKLLRKMIRRVGELAPCEAGPDELWEVFRNSQDAELDRLEEAFFELARFLSDLMQVDGALVVDPRLRILGFGGEIRVDRNVLMVSQALDLDACVVTDWDVQGDGTRHRSVYRLCSVEPQVIGFVISQDSQVRMIANINDAVTFWPHTVI